MADINNPLPGSPVGGPPKPPFSPPPRPPQPPSQPLPQPRSFQPAPPPRPAGGPPIPSSSQQSSSGQNYQSSIRTMESDLEALKRGQSPTGVNVEKKTTPDLPGITVPQAPKTPLSPQPSLPKPTPLAPFPSAPKPASPAGKPAFSVPQTGGGMLGNKKLIIIGIAVLVLVGGFFSWYFIWRSDGQDVAYSPTPTPSISETPMPNTFEPEFGTPTDIVVSRGYPNFADLVMSEILTVSEPDALPGEFRPYTIVDNENSKYTLGEFFSELGVTSEVASSEAFNTLNWILVTYGHNDENSVLVNRLFIVLETGDMASVPMLNWELDNRLVNDMADLFGYQPIQTGLVSDVYNGLNFKFAKLLSRDMGISYVTFGDYLVIASSRDSFRAAVDALNLPTE